MAARQRDLQHLWSSIATSSPAAWPSLADSAFIAQCNEHKGSAPAFFAALRGAVSRTLQSPADGKAAGAAAVLEAGMACLHAFLQINLCGPIHNQHTPLWQPAAAAAAGAASSGPCHQDGPAGTWGRDRPEHKLGQDSLSADERWVMAQLEVDGEDVVGRIRGLDLLLAALLCIAEPLGHYTTTDKQQQQDSSQQIAAAAAAGAGGSTANGIAAENHQQQQEQKQQQRGLLSTAELQEYGLGSWCWWCMRAVLLQQHVLSGRSITLQSTLKHLTQQTLTWVEDLQAEAPTTTAAQGHSSSTQQHPEQQQQNGLQQQGVSAAAEAAVQGQVLAAVAHLEVALVQQTVGVVAEAQQQLQEAAAALGVTVELTGALGVRTQHQIDPKAQLIAAVKAVGSSGSSAAAVTGLEGLALSQLGFEEVGLTKELEGMTDDSAVYLAPRLMEQPGTAAEAAAGAAAVAAAGEQSSSSSNGGSGEMNGAQPQQQEQEQLSPLLQALLLGWAAQIKKGTSQDELQQWQMAPFVEAVLQQQQHTQYMLQATARLLKCRHEKARGRTRERALMQLEQLCSALEAQQPALSVRLPYAFAVRFPLWPLLRKELAEFYIAMGFVGAALKIFEELEMWDQLIVCYRLLDKKQAAQELVLERLKWCPSDAKLWCALGDITQQDEHYVKAWEVSGHRSSRAQRSLGRSALRKQEYGEAAAVYEAALGLNPLYPDVWFSLGYCYLKTGQIQKALQAFSKVTHQEPEHGEAWANLSALWLQEGGWREALHAAEQAIKHKRDSWQTWDNYALAAAKADAPAACVRGLAEVLELTNGQHFPLQTAESLMTILEQQHTQPTSDSSTDTGPAAAAAAAAADECGEDMEAPEQLLQMLNLTASLTGSSNTGGTDTSSSSKDDAGDQAAQQQQQQQRSFQQVLQQFGGVLKSVMNAPSCGAAVWGLLGRWYALQGQLVSSQEARLKQVRALQSSPYKSDPEAFTAMAEASAQLCRAYLSSAAAGQGGTRELAAARMHLKGLLKQCEVAFEERPEYQQLQGLLTEVTAAEDAAVAAKKAAGQS